MDPRNMRRQTTDEDPAALPSAQVYLELGGCVWHDLHFVHAALHKQGLARDKKSWLRDCRK